MIVLAILCATAADPPEAGTVDPPAVESTTDEVIAESTDSGVSPEAALLDSFRTGGIGALRSLWSDLGIKSDLFAGRAETDPLDVVRFGVELDGSPGEELLLIVTDAGACDYQVLALEHLESGWSDLGYVDLRNQRSGSPQHRIETMDADQRWLVIRAVKSSGNGFSRVNDTWYATGGSLRAVLSYPVEGQVEGHGMAFNRSFSGSGKAAGVIESNPTVDVELSARYTNGDLFAIDGLTELFTRTATVRYVLESAQDRFELDEAQSGMNEAEIEGIFGDDAEGFLSHNFTQLKEMAQGGDDPKRQWLRKFLEGREESSEKSVLLGLLGPEEALGEPAADQPPPP